MTGMTGAMTVLENGLETVITGLAWKRAAVGLESMNLDPTYPEGTCLMRWKRGRKDFFSLRRSTLIQGESTGNRSLEPSAGPSLEDVQSSVEAVYMVIEQVVSNHSTSSVTTESLGLGR
jgi:hypothetical protein